MSTFGLISNGCNFKSATTGQKRATLAGGAAPRAANKLGCAPGADVMAAGDVGQVIRIRKLSTSAKLSPKLAPGVELLVKSRPQKEVAGSTRYT